MSPFLPACCGIHSPLAGPSGRGTEGSFTHARKRSSKMPPDRGSNIFSLSTFPGCIPLFLYPRVVSGIRNTCALSPGGGVKLYGSWLVLAWGCAVEIKPSLLRLNLAVRVTSAAEAAANSHIKPVEFWAFCGNGFFFFLNTAIILLLSMKTGPRKRRRCKRSVLWQACCLRCLLEVYCQTFYKLLLKCCHWDRKMQHWKTIIKLSKEHV